MAFDWRSFLTLAESLDRQAGEALDPAHEASLRSAISRAYYGAFGHAYRYATQWLGFSGRVRPEERSQDHGRLAAWLRQRRRTRVSDMLSLLRRLRNACDYESELPPDFLEENVATALEAARYVFDALPPPAEAPEGTP